MQPCLCKKHLLQVANTFDKVTAFAYALDEKNCVICNKVIFIEGARRYVSGMPHKMHDPALRLPTTQIHKNV